MEIHVSDRQLRKALDDHALCQRRFGTDMTKKLFLRLAALRAADSLAVFWPPKSGPERCHELAGDRTGIFSVDLKQPYRLLFKVHDEVPAPRGSDERERWKMTTAIDLLAIEDTHG
jgi:plasmid maintenance system killer protein